MKDYANALVEAQKGLMGAEGLYVLHDGTKDDKENLFYQFSVEQRADI